MWFKSIHARAFGPLRDCGLKFEKGLNVVHGPNEAGKSTWHAAITAALCGLRRGAGRDTAREKFTARHRPWGAADGDPWSVQMGLVLDDSRHIEIDRDFENGGTHARRADLGGREFTDLPMNEGSPDAAKCLGLDRRTFPMTASVRQASIISDLGNPDALQQHLARAAAGGEGGTAAGALRRLETYKKAHVGRNQRNSVRPLRTATVGMAEAREDLARVEDAHGEYLELVSNVVAHRRTVTQLTGEKTATEAQRDYRAAKREAGQLAAAMTKIGEWQQRFSAGDPSQRELVEPVELSDALARIDSLPAPASTTLDAVPDLESELCEMDSHRELPCPELSDVQQCVAPLRRLGPPETDTAEAATPRIKAATPALIVAIVAGAAVGTLYGVGAGLLAAIAGGIVVACAAFVVQRANARGTRRSSLRSGRESEIAARDEAVRRLGEWQLPLDDPDAAVREASDRLQERAERSARRRQLLQDRDRRKEFDDAEAQRKESHEAAWARLRDLASGYGMDGSDEEIRSGAQQVFNTHTDAQRQLKKDVEEWGRYQQALDGRTPQDWREEAAAGRTAESESLERLRLLGVEPAGPSVETSDLDIKVTGLDRAIREASDRAKLAEGELRNVDQESVDVAAAEARLSEAGAELDRVERLADRLETTSGFLEKAAEKAHMLIAPRLAKQMSPWILKVTNGRYARVEVDPGDLSVTLVTAAGERRDARLVSRGTMEQVYLVLRLVLAQVLSADHETCPVLLDDPTVHADAERKKEVLDYLLAASKDHQVILFSQEQEVLDWARNQPAGSVRLIELTEPQPA